MIHRRRLSRALANFAIALPTLTAAACIGDENRPAPKVTLNLRWRRVEHESMVGGLFFARDDRQAFSFSSYRPRGYTCIWDSTNGELIRQVTADEGRVFRMQLSNDGRLLFQGGEHGQVFVHDLEREGSEVRVLRSPGDTVSALCCVADGKMVVAGDRKGRIHGWRLPSEEAVLDRKAHAKYVYRLRFVRDSTTLLSVGTETEADPSLERGIEPSPFPSKAYISAMNAERSTVKFWNLATQRVDTSLASTEFTITDAFPLDGRKELLTVDRGHNIVVWDLATLDERRRWSTRDDSFCEIAVTPDQRLLATTNGDHIKLWQISSGALLHTCFLKREEIDACSIAFSHDGRMLLVGGMLSHAVALFDIVEEAGD